MMLLHCIAWTSTFGAHPHHPERLPNLNLMVRVHPTNVMNRMPPCGYLYVVHQFFCCVQPRFNSDCKKLM